MVQKDNFKIYLNFYSDFAKGILFKGNCNKYEIEMLITEVMNIQIISNQQY